MAMSTPRTDGGNILTSSSHLASDTPRTNLSFFDARDVERRTDGQRDGEIELTSEANLAPLHSARTAASSTTVTPRQPQGLAKTSSTTIHCTHNDKRRSVDVDALGHLQGDVELYGSPGPSEMFVVPPPPRADSGGAA